MLRSVLALTLSCALATPTLATEPSALRRAELSARLYEAGVADADPLLVLAAARLRKSIAPTEGTLRPSEPEAGGDPQAGAPLRWQDMVATAEALAPGDDLIAGLAEDIRAETTKGVVSGPIYGLSSLSAGRADLYERIDFRGGEYAVVYVEAKASTDMKLFVEDAQGRLVCSDTDISHIAYCGWRPAETGSFTIRVENRGPRSAGYALMTN